MTADVYGHILDPDRRKLPMPWVNAVEYRGSLVVDLCRQRFRNIAVKSLTNDEATSTNLHALEFAIAQKQERGKCTDFTAFRRMPRMTLVSQPTTRSLYLMPYYRSRSRYGGYGAHRRLLWNEPRERIASSTRSESTQKRVGLPSLRRPDTDASKLSNPFTRSVDHIIPVSKGGSDVLTIGTRTSEVQFRSR